MNLFKRFTKWEIYKSNEVMVEKEYAPPLLGGGLISSRDVKVDTYVRYNKRTGLPEYKKIIV